jgi:hypothetical protein
LGIERCGKINASNSGAESWPGIGVVADGYPVVRIMPGHHVRNGECTGEANYFRYHNRLGPFAKLATSYGKKKMTGFGSIVLVQYDDGYRTRSS